MFELTQEEKFEIIYNRLKETNMELDEDKLNELCNKIMSKNTLELANYGYNAVMKERVN
jgi:hypothetical protein